MERFDRQPDNVKGAFILMLAAFGFSLMVAMVKLASERLPVTQILFLRQLGMTIMLTPVLLKSFPDSLRTTRLPVQIARILLAMKANIYAYTYGEASLLASGADAREFSNS